MQTPKLLVIGAFLGGPLWVSDWLKPDLGTNAALVFAMPPAMFLLIGLLGIRSTPDSIWPRIAGWLGALGAALMLMASAVTLLIGLGRGPAISYLNWIGLLVTIPLVVMFTRSLLRFQALPTDPALYEDCPTCEHHQLPGARCSRCGYMFDGVPPETVFEAVQFEESAEQLKIVVQPPQPVFAWMIVLVLSGCVIGIWATALDSGAEGSQVLAYSVLTLICGAGIYVGTAKALNRLVLLTDGDFLRIVRAPIPWLQSQPVAIDRIEGLFLTSPRGAANEDAPRDFTVHARLPGKAVRQLVWGLPTAAEAQAVIDRLEARLEL